jgi:DNA-binding FadR family transcriptional regulator
VAFHFVLAEMTGNPIFAAIHDATSSWLREQRAVSIALPGQMQMRQGAEAHRAIHAAVAARDPDRAEAAMRDHLTQVTGAYWRARAEEG